MKNTELISPQKFENPVCAQVGPSFFYIDDDDEEFTNPELANTSYKTAIELCKSCSHIADCAEWGVRKERWGVWGGLTPYDRMKIRRSRKITLLDS